MRHEMRHGMEHELVLGSCDLRSNMSWGLGVKLEHEIGIGTWDLGNKL